MDSYDPADPVRVRAYRYGIGPLDPRVFAIWGRLTSRCFAGVMNAWTTPAMVARSLQMALIQPCMLPVEPSREALMERVFFLLLFIFISLRA